MDKRREELEEQKADLHLALLMDEYAERMGKQVREEAEAAFERGELELPLELDAKCRALISDAPTADEKKKPMKAVARYALVAALSIILLLGTLVAVQAAGIDVFGSIASWTDSVFHFQNNNAEVTDGFAEPENQIQAALRELGMPEELAPTKLPDGYAFTSVDIIATKKNKMVCGFAEKDGAEPLQIVIQESTSDDIVNDETWEKDYQKIEAYPFNDRLYYLFVNADSWQGVWSDGHYSIKLYGATCKDDLLILLKSIGEITDD